MVGEYGHDNGIFHQIIFLESIEKIEISVPGCAWNAILDELESGKSRSIERYVVCAANAL
jgi:hypothetical protein